MSKFFVFVGLIGFAFSAHAQTQVKLRDGRVLELSKDDIAQIISSAAESLARENAYQPELLPDGTVIFRNPKLGIYALAFNRAENIPSDKKLKGQGRAFCRLKGFKDVVTDPELNEIYPQIIAESPRQYIPYVMMNGIESNASANGFVERPRIGVVITQETPNVLNQQISLMTKVRCEN